MNTEAIDTTAGIVPTGAGSPARDEHFIRLQNINKVFGERHGKAMKLLHQARTTKRLPLKPAVMWR
ncbi:hypothetical protein TKWG_19475 [Advenella kashmirensis WT001]|uniref:Uncharacterized protein n=1 Tax=Advenella kashmirensis (strain DSM 17095 / LMG 22695 / WT001) TaxID=1036672 RepID=I3UFA5_ADVKW|nr:hypothetical protein [Advenella kashmirensis]AFK63693.1 hypothetical protein TKWG_19475 [Advenella kashmirensis WT001]